VITNHTWYNKIAHIALDNGECVRCEIKQILFQTNFLGIQVRYRDKISKINKKRYVSVILIAALHYIWCDNRLQKGFRSDEDDESEFKKLNRRVTGVLPLLLISEEDEIKLSEQQHDIFAWQVRQTILLGKYLYKVLPISIQQAIDANIALLNDKYINQTQKKDEIKINGNKEDDLEKADGVTISDHSWFGRTAHIKLMNNKVHRAEILELIMQPPLLGLQMRYILNDEEEFERFSPIFLYAQHYAWFDRVCVSEPEDETEFHNKRVTLNLPQLRLSEKVQTKLSSLEKDSFSWEVKQVDSLVQVLLRMQADASQ
jgi:hypothetical protein